MALLRALHAETLKLKRTTALWMVLVAPAVIVLLTFVVTYENLGISTLNRQGARNDWMELTRLNLQFYGLLMMPLYITLETALVAGLDHAENQWRSILARPVPRWTLYLAKLLVVMAMTVVSTVVLLSGIVVTGAVMPWLQSHTGNGVRISYPPPITFGLPVPWAAICREGAQVTGLAFLALTIQHWVSVRWRSFSVAIGIGIVAMVVGVIASSQPADGWSQYFPWALPMLVLSRRPHNIEAALWISGAIGLAAVAAGCSDFCSREVK